MTVVQTVNTWPHLVELVLTGGATSESFTFGQPTRLKRMFLSAFTEASVAGGPVNVSVTIPPGQSYPLYESYAQMMTDGVGVYERLHKCCCLGDLLVPRNSSVSLTYVGDDARLVLEVEPV